ncbi:hypothetical protein [Acetivibrio clariflavus]|uniref:hypothetical protein n=1 Tax=Acetivibrio clariflavus TaxID=288965 RepID=UPI00048078B6|nr:hypothetical protein [Acetivibrio clariflavus]
MAMTDRDLWDKYVTQLTNYVTGGQFDKENQVICFASNTLMVDLANKDSKVSNYNIYNIGNLIPKCSPAYTPHSDLIGAYSSFLNYIDLGGEYNPNLDSQINIAAGKLTEASQNFQKQCSQTIQDWKNMKEAMPNLDWPTYIQQFGSIYTEAKAYMDSCQTEYNNLVRKKSGSDYQALLNAQSRVGFTGGARDIINKNPYNMWARVGTEAPLGCVTTLPGQTLAEPDSSYVDILVPGYNLNAFSTAYMEWQAKSSRGIVDVGPLEISGSSETLNYSEFGWNTSVNGSYFGKFFSIFGSLEASGKEIKSDWQPTNFSLKIYYTGLQTFKIEPLLWFQQSFIENYKDKLFKNAPNFFGKDGSLSLLPYEIIVGFEPRIELTLNNSDYKELKSAFNASASLSIGPFRIGKANVSTYGSKEDVKFYDESNTLTVGPIKSQLPLLLGVICSKL